MKRQTITIDTDMTVSHILATFDMADTIMLADGARWYSDMLAMMREHSDASGLTVIQCAAIYASTSINTRWAQNVKLARQAIETRTISGTLDMIVAKVTAILAYDGDDMSIIDSILTCDPNNYKLRSFTRNMLGDDDAVTVDRWAYRIASDFEGCERREGCTRIAKGKRAGQYTGKHSCGKVPSGEEYLAYANAYRIAASMRGVTPAVMQAVTWCVVRGTGE